MVTLPLFYPVKCLDTKFQSYHKVIFLNITFQAYNKGNYKHAYTYHLNKARFCHTLSSVYPMIYFLLCVSTFINIYIWFLSFWVYKAFTVKFTVKWTNVKCTLDEFWCTICNPNPQQAMKRRRHIGKFLHLSHLFSLLECSPWISLAILELHRNGII